MTQPPENGRHGFVLHDDCWRLLQRASPSGPISISRLLEACESLPFPLPTNSVFWGHDFGGLWTRDIHHRYRPSPELYLLPRRPSKVFWDGLESPLDVPCISGMLSAQSKPPFDKPLIKESHDFFALLPWEILENIGICLATRDAFQLRHASASFLPLYISGAFWASRFSVGGERGFLFEADRPRDYLEWITLYKLSKSPSQIPGLRNRQRVWSLARLVAIVTQRYRADSLPSTAKAGYSRESSVRVSFDNYSDDGNEWCGFFHKSCRPFGTSLLNLPVDLMQVGVTIIDMGLCTYVAGLRFVAKDQLDTKIGYVADGQDRVFAISELRGFKVANSPSGIRALQIVGSSGRCTEWAGDPTAMPVSNCLLKRKPVRSVEIECDVRTVPFPIIEK